MHYLFDLLQGLGLAAAIGIRPFLPALLAGALAAQNAGIDFDGTSFAFLEKTGFLFALLVGVFAFGVVERRLSADQKSQSPWSAVLIAVALVLGALFAAGSIADRSTDWYPGLVVGILGAGLAFTATRSLLGRVRARLDEKTAAALPLYAEAAALLSAGLSILLPPLAILIVAGLAWLLIGGRRRAGEKYAGLRILR